MNVLIDTSVWVDHFKYGNAHLIQLLEQDFALTHPMVILELACGTPPAPRSQTLNAIAQLRHSESATDFEVMAWIEQQQLYGLGCGLVDLSLLAATQLTPQTKLWTLDKRLQQLALRFDLAYVGESLH
ncbi:MAG: type II toxin-antitoxin system VapC family toxin [Acinetobacter sp.]|nr:type II toxin-antitoxin system VapC family toxin [Acinetobacter sp.]MBP6352647.1 type II toxin-antitoxin system VapC family toxin [Acinetobacter sp.]MBP7218291.1 type II toxin-antitoxin system VapC family toxin [Acinetobacter sp.]TXJ02998.1 MAG: type II toxin-antitoxin system VapC family toxin [Acinetobacter sp.]